MSNAAGIVLNKILTDPAESLEVWSKLKVHFFPPEYLHIFTSIVKYYNKYNSIPSFDDILLTTRDEQLLQKIVALRDINVPEDVDIAIAVDALVDQFTQEEVLTSISKFVEKVPIYDTEEIKEKLSDILVSLDDKTASSEEIYLMNQIYIVDKEEIKNRIPLGISNVLDARDGGTPTTELIMLGGSRGSGKSILAVNITTNQYLQGNIGLYFSIEMRYREVFNRMIGNLASVDVSRIAKGECTIEDYEKIAKVRSGMFEDSADIYDQYLEHKDYEKFEIDLIRSSTLKKENQIIIVDNQALTPTEIDLTVQKFKTKFGDKLKVVVVDYVNQICVPDIYDWKVQIHLSKTLKNIARKHDVRVITPYQTDKQGEARLSKGILDAADVAANLTPESDHIKLISTKTRNIAKFKVSCPINWTTCTISPDGSFIEDHEIDQKDELPDPNREKPKDIPF